MRILALILFFTSLAFPQTNNIESLKQHLNSALPKEKIQILSLLISKNPNFYESSHYFEEGTKITLEYKDEIGRAKIIYSYVKALISIRNYHEALNYSFEALRIYTDNNDTRNIERINNTIGVIYFKMEDYTQALEYHAIALDIVAELKDSLETAKTFAHIGKAYLAQDNFKFALRNLKKAIDIELAHDFKPELIEGYSCLGTAYLKTINFTEANNYFNKALDLSIQLNDSLKIAKSYHNFSLFYIEKKEYITAIDFLHKTLPILKRLGKKDLEIEYHRLSADLHLIIKDFEEAYSHFKQFIELTEELDKNYSNLQTIEIEEYYDLINIQDRIQELVVERDNLIKNLLIITIVFLAILIFIFYKRARLQAETTEQISKQNQKLQLLNLDLIQARDTAEHANRLKSEFLAQISHEIRSPLNTILNFTSLLKMDLQKKLTKDNQESFNSIENASRRLTRTIDLTLNMSELEVGSFEAHFTFLDLHKKVLIPLHREFAGVCEKKNLKLRLENNLEKLFYVKVDEYTVTQAVANLIDNAIKYTDKGEISIVYYQNHKGLCLDVTDTGIGIAESYMPNLFTIFTQEEQGYTRKFEGTGLGLALVKKYCDINNIELTVESKKDEGSTFRLTFPPEKISDTK